MANSLLIINSTMLTPNRFGSIFVPESLVSDYKIASGWSYFSDRIVGYTPT